MDGGMFTLEGLNHVASSSGIADVVGQEFNRNASNSISSAESFATNTLPSQGASQSKGRF